MKLRNIKSAIIVFFRRLTCKHDYVKDGWYEDSNGYIRYAMRQYHCEKCGKVIVVDGRYDTIAR